MSNALHTPALSFAPAEHPGERRQRHTMPVAAVGTASPVPASLSDTLHAGSTATRSARPLGRVIHLASVGVWTVTLGGCLAEIGGVICWPDRESLTLAAAQAGMELSDLVTRTGQGG
ncbi:hypothetical protein M2352_000495 [Azospirillum fermentarium]|uniref:hypothetical protein n=1 Tax=Azospirillum fermentarium TaxID=1233114 RepID=UPI002227CBB4|nr:hypothetical protein [Azospirillum fermentarium]MCW2244904.1 hypothetical protein [Azospirillum fermentarium]